MSGRKEKIMKRYSLAAILALCAMLASCSEKKGDGSDISKQDASADSRPVVKVVDLVGKPKTLSPNNSEYTFEFTSYSENYDIDADAVFSQLRMDILGGVPPDVLMFPPEYTLCLAKAGFTEDLSPYMEKTESLRRERFLPNLMENLEIDGKVPALISGFTMETYAAKTVHVGKNAENWTFAQAEELLRSIPEGCDFIVDMPTMLSNDAGYYNESPLARFFLGRYRDHGTDSSGKSADYGESFGNALRIAYENNDLVSNITDVVDGSTLAADKAFVGEIYMNNFGGSVCGLYAEFGGEDITFVGYPSDNGTGAFILPRAMYSIAATSNNKDGAWAFIEREFELTDYYEENASFPPFTDILEDTALRQDKNSKLGLHAVFTMGNGEESTVTDEFIEEVLAYIKRLKLDPYAQNDKIRDIVSEEVDKMIAGEQTPEKCREMVENRVNIYLSESY